MPLALRGRTDEPSVHINAKTKESESTTGSGIQPCSKAICREKKGVESTTRSGGEVNATMNNVGF